MAFTVLVNGTARTPDANSLISVAPGDQVNVLPTTAANWVGVSAAGSTITLRNNTATSTAWSAQIVNGLTTAGSYTLTATSAGNTGYSRSVTLSVSAGDSRNGSYSVFATNGTRQQLALNFDVRSYDMTDAPNATVSGSFVADAEAGTWDFSSPRGTAAVTARFRTTTDTVVGGFPFSTAFGASGAYNVQPFVGSRALVTTQASLAGIYDQVGIVLTSSSRDSSNRQAQIRTGGTTMDICEDSNLDTIATCTTVSTYTITPNATTAGRWDLTNVADGSYSGGFSIANVAGQNMYLSAGTSTTVAGGVLFRIGMLDNTFTGGVARGGDTTGAWGINTSSTTVSTSSGVDVNGNALTALTVPFNAIRAATPPGMRDGTATVGGNTYWLTQGNKIGAMVGKHTSGFAQGYLQIGILD